MSAPTLIPAIAEAERCLAEAIKHFGLEVKPSQIVVTIQSRGRKNAVGWFCPKSWANGKPGALHEINLSAEHLTDHDMGELILHELAHAENEHKGIKDHSKTGQVHNKHFKSMAERLGLKCRERDKKVGYGYTLLDSGGERFLKMCAFKRQVFTCMRLLKAADPAADSRLLKCECPACGYVVRTTKKWLAVGNPFCPCGTEMKAEAAA